jgi:hypothetical protein
MVITDCCLGAVAVSEASMADSDYFDEDKYRQHKNSSREEPIELIRRILWRRKQLGYAMTLALMTTIFWSIMGLFFSSIWGAWRYDTLLWYKVLTVTVSMSIIVSLLILCTPPGLVAFPIILIEPFQHVKDILCRARSLTHGSTQRMLVSWLPMMVVWLGFASTLSYIVASAVAAITRFLHPTESNYLRTEEKEDWLFVALFGLVTLSLPVLLALPLLSM